MTTKRFFMSIFVFQKILMRFLHFSEIFFFSLLRTVTPHGLTKAQQLLSDHEVSANSHIGRETHTFD